MEDYNRTGGDLQHLSLLRLSRRRSLESDGQAHTHRELPILKRATTTTTASRSRSHRIVELEGVQNVSAAMPSHWPVPSSSSLGRQSSVGEAYEHSRSRRGDPLSSLDSDLRATDIAVVEPDSDDPTNFSRSLEINMKDLVGDAVGNVSSHSQREKRF